MSMLLVFSCSVLAAAGTGTPLVVDGRAIAVIVLPDEPEPIAEYAADELVYHVKKSTGAKLDVRREPLRKNIAGPVIYLGATQAARDAGIDPDALESEAVVLRTIGNALYIVGRDGPGDPVSTGNSTSGTLFGVYELLERYAGVRWLWPGELGEIIPKADALAIPPLDETLEPRFSMRQLRPGLGRRGFIEAQALLAFSPKNSERYAADQNAFLRRHRMGRAEDHFYAQRKSGSGHAFEGWWERYGAEHPDWFQMLPDGRRGPENPAKPRKVSMCVSNPQFHAKIIELWQEERTKRPGQQVNIGISENDTSALCVCPQCVAWDGPPRDMSGLPAGLERSFEPVQAGNRYARFAKSVYELAAAIDPNVKVNIYAYLNYFWAPEPTIELHPNIVIGFVPWFRWAGWFPRTEAEHEWIKQQWMGWQKTGASIYYRPNWFLDGYTMPLVYMHQFGDAFQFYAQYGMTGTDFDSLQGQWAAQGPNLYLLARIHVRPEMPIDSILEEYYSGFGPAADEVKEYFEYWERYAIENSPRAANAIKSRSDGAFRRYALYAAVADELYPLEVFEPGEAILERAAQAANSSEDRVYRRRVEFLDQGLAHAKQCVATASVVNNANTTIEERKAAIKELIKVRRKLEGANIANMDRAAIIETDSWKGMPELFEP